MKQSSPLKWAGTIARNLADDGITIYFAMPHTSDGYRYDFEALVSRGHQNIIPFPVTITSDTKLGLLAWGMDLLKLLTPRTSPIPFDAVITPCSAMVVPMYRCLTDAVYSRITPAVITILDVAASYDEFNRAPIGIQEWYQQWEYLEAGAALFGKVITGNPYDYGVVQRVYKKLFSLSRLKIAMSNLHMFWQPVAPVVDFTPRTAPQEGAEWKALAVGGFGTSREEMHEQAEMMVEAMEYFQRFTKLNMKLYVCTQTPPTTWHDEVQRRLGDRIEINFNPPRDRFQELMRTCHFAINCRKYDGVNLAFLEQAIAGIPIIWCDSPYFRGWVYGGGFEETRFATVKSFDTAQLVVAIQKIIQNYPKACEVAEKFSRHVQKRHDAGVWRENMRKILTEAVQQAQQRFWNGNFDVMNSAFARAVKEVQECSFEELQKQIAQYTKTNILSLYGKHWILCMLRRHGLVEFVKNGELFLRRATPYERKKRSIKS